MGKSHLKRAILPVLAATAAVAGVLTNLTTIRNAIVSFPPHGPKRDRLEIASATIVNSDTVDVTVLNPTATTIVISGVEAHVDRVWEVSTTGSLAALILRTATYDLTLPNKQAPYTVVRQIAHAVKPNETDRLGITFTGGPGTYFVTLSLTLAHSGTGVTPVPWTDED